jgi:hypothetical protein
MPVSPWTERKTARRTGCPNAGFSMDGTENGATDRMSKYRDPMDRNERRNPSLLYPEFSGPHKMI